VSVKARFAICLIFCAVLILCQPVGRTQVGNATITGRVLDPSHAPIPNATITVLNVDTQSTHKAVTNDDGLFAISELAPGNYRIETAKLGFKTVIKPDVVLHVQDVIAINFNMTLGAVTESVTVEGGAPLLNTESGAVSTVVDRQFAEKIPLNGQSFNTLLLLTPGVVLAPATNAISPGQFSVNGQRTDSNYFMVDGVGSNFGASTHQVPGQAGGGGTQAFNAYGGTASLVSVDAMQEFRVETSSFAPEYGRTPGGQVSISTRSGTNSLHGDVFNYFRNTVLDANDWFANSAGKQRAPEHQNDFGGVAGGPIIGDKAFFFFSYEGLRLDQPQATVVQVPSLQARQSAVSAAAAILNGFPLPDPNSVVSPDGYVAQLTGVYSNRITMNAVSLRVDQVINNKLNIFGRFNYSPSELVTRVSNLSQLQNQQINTTTVTLGSNAPLGLNKTNSLRFNYSQQTGGQSSKIDSFGGAVPISPALLLPTPYSVSNSTATFAAFLSGVLAFDQIGTLANNRVSQWALVDDISALKGSHELKFGANYTRLFSTNAGFAFSPQYYVFGSQDFQHFLSTGVVTKFVNAIVNPSKIVFHEFSLYAQDRWRAGERLTLTYGLRWELNPAPVGQNSPLASWEHTDDPAKLAIAPPGTSVWNTIYTNFAPRFGFAYRVTSGGDLVVRGGTGVFYDLGTGLAATLPTQFPNGAAFRDFSGTNSYALPVTNVPAVTPSFSLSPPYTGNMTGFSQGLKLPYSYQWNVAVEKSVHKDQSISLTYLGQIGRRLLRLEVLPAPNNNFVNNVFVLTNNGDTSNYNAAQVQYKKRMSHGLQALLNYTWSHSFDTNSDDTNTTVPGTFLPVPGQRGTSDFDVRQSVSGAFVYAIPTAKKNMVLQKITAGWSLTGFALARTGFPVRIFDYTFFGGQFYTVPPDLVPGQPVWVTQAGVPGGRVLNRNAFAAPATPRQGTLPRNSIPGFGASQFDTSVERDFGITERVHLRFRGDIFNLFNHPNFANPNGDLSSSRFGTTSSMLNQATSAGLNSLYSIGGPRSTQLSLKLFF
jgi:hypothetical protein